MDISRAPILSGLTSEFIRVQAGVQPQAVGKGRCVACVFQNTSLDDARVANAKVIMAGRFTGQPLRCLPDDSFSPVVYADDLEDLAVRLENPALTPTNITVLVYRFKREGEK